MIGTVLANHAPDLQRYSTQRSTEKVRQTFISKKYDNEISKASRNLTKAKLKYRLAQVKLRRRLAEIRAFMKKEKVTPIMLRASGKKERNQIAVDEENNKASIRKWYKNIERRLRGEIQTKKQKVALKNKFRKKILDQKKISFAKQKAII